MGLAIRDGREEDAARVATLTTDTWPDREVDDYVGDAYPRWVREAADRADRRVLVGERNGEVVAVVRGCLLSETEGWASGLRVAPAARGEGVGARLTRAALDWLQSAGATVCRNLVFGWNAPSLALSRATGFDPVTEFRFVTVAPDRDASAGSSVADDARAALSFWDACRAKRHLAGLALDPGETWAFSELTRERVRTAVGEDRLIVVGAKEEVDGVTLRTRVHDYGDGERIAEYGVGAWRPGDVEAASALFEAVRADAARAGADRARVVVPERATWVTDAASAGASLADAPDFVLAADLAG